VTLRQDFTADRNAANAAIDALTRGGSTALYRAIQTGAQALAGRGGRKAIVVMTDGENTVSGVTLEQAIAAARQAGAPVFPVGFSSGPDHTVLGRIASETGGFYSRGSTSADLQRILQLIGQVISSQYEISYTSANPPASNTIEITVSSGGQSATATRVVPGCTAGGGTTPGCNYNVPPTSSVAGSGGTGIVLVTTAANCAWTATSNAAWLTIIAGASGTGNGAVNYRATANPSTTASRTGTLTIAGVTHTVTQGPAGVACT
jgi:hypothetical protein